MTSPKHSAIDSNIYPLVVSQLQMPKLQVMQLYFCRSVIGITYKVCK